jgi:hypothetical protein
MDHFEESSRQFSLFLAPVNTSQVTISVAVKYQAEKYLKVIVSTPPHPHNSSSGKTCRYRISLAVVP